MVEHLLCKQGVRGSIPLVSTIMEKIDFKNSRPNSFKATTKFNLVSFPKYKYLMVDGKGDPNKSSEYVKAIELLYSIAYTLKFTRKNSGNGDFVVPPLEGLWWANDYKSFTKGDKSKWLWTMMIMVPDDVSQTEFKQCIKSIKEKKGIDTELIRLDYLNEGNCVQYLHIGPYSEEGPRIKEMHEVFMPKNGLAPTGKHHEIYLGDPRKSDPEKLKTIIRQPARKIK